MDTILYYFYLAQSEREVVDFFCISYLSPMIVQKMVQYMGKQKNLLRNREEKKEEEQRFFSCKKFGEFQLAKLYDIFAIFPALYKENN